MMAGHVRFTSLDDAEFGFWVVRGFDIRSRIFFYSKTFFSLVQRDRGCMVFVLGRAARCIRRGILMDTGKLGGREAYVYEIYI